MSKPRLIKEDEILENELIETFLAGHKQYRPDLAYPQSHSDMGAGIRGLLRMFIIKRSALPVPLRVLCDNCNGLGELVVDTKDGIHHTTTCKICKHKGYTEG